MLLFDAAQAIVTQHARPLESESADLSEALGRVLAEDVFSDLDMPPFDKSAMDGYACRRTDLQETLVVTETVKAGVSPGKKVGPRECAKIMTGAMVPEGADCVIMVEHTETDGAGRVRFAGEGAPNNHLLSGRGHSHG